MALPKLINGWLTKSLLTVVFLGITGWIGYNTYAGDQREAKIGSNTSAIERHNAEIEALKSMTVRSVTQQEKMILEMREQGRTLAEISRVLRLIEEGKLKVN